MILRKRLLFFALFLGLAGLVWAACAWFFRRPSEALAAVPRSTALVAEVRDFSKKRAAADAVLRETGVADLAVFRHFEDDLAFVERIFSKNGDFKTALESASLVAAWSLTPADSGRCAVVLDLGEGAAADIKNWLPISQATRHFPYNFRGGEIFNAYLGAEKITMAGRGRLLIFSRKTYLVEECLLQLLRPGTSALDDPDFRKTAEKTPNSLGFRLFLNPSALFENLEPDFFESKKAALRAFSRAGKWAGIGLADGENGLEFDGFLSLFEPENEAAEPSFFEKTTARDLEPISKILPENTAFFGWLTARDGSDFLAKKPPLEKGQPLPRPSDFEKYCSSWLGAEACFFVAEPFSAGFENEFFVALEIADSLENLRKMARFGHEKGVLRRWRYQTWLCYQFLGDGVLDEILPSGAAPIFKNPCSAQLGGYQIFAPSPSALELLIDKFIASQTLSNQPNFLVLKKKWPDEPESFAFFRADFLPALFGGLFENGLSRASKSDLQKLRRLGSLGFSVEKTGDAGWQKIRLRAEPPAEKAASSSTILWKTELPAEAVSGPSVVALPRGRGHRIFAQTVDNELVMISEGGETVWKKPLAGRILGVVQGVEYEGDGEPFYLFTTAEKIHLIDDRGEDALGWPLILPSRATAAAAVFDFDGTGQLAFFVPCLNEKTYGFGHRGRPIEGWNPCPTGASRQPVQHFQWDWKDFLVVLSENGRLAAYSRAGDLRFSKKLDGRFSGPFQIDRGPEKRANAGPEPRIALADRSGRAWAVRPSDGLGFPIKSAEKGRKPTHFVFADLVGDGRRDYFFLGDTSLAGFAYSPENKLEKVFLQRIWEPRDSLFEVRFGRGERRLGSVDRAAGQIFLTDGAGRDLPDFPLAGTTAFSVADLLEKGNANVLVVANGRAIYAFLLRG